VETQADLADEFGITQSTSVVETRKYAYHRKIERNRTAARHGTIGDGFIEAHHLKAISALEEGVAVAYDIAADFAVLCSNCHRVIHRSADPSNLELFWDLLAANKA
jgi:5-methylcytosine-specific restriction protein A